MPSMKQNSFNDKIKIALITAVYPDTKTCDIEYISQQGNYKNLQFPYSVIGLTWGMTFCPLKGDKVLVDTSNGDKPVITSTYASNTDLINYVDPGELALMSENGSYLHVKNQRKRAISQDMLLDYDATEGPNGATDIQYEPSGLILQVRTKQSRDQLAPRYNLHSSLSMFDNGDINIQSSVNSVPKGLLHFNGATGYVFLMSGNSKTQEYLEMNPLKKEVVLFSDGELHLHGQTNQKQNVYGNIVYNVGGGLQYSVGVPLGNIPASFDNVMANNVSNYGDMYFDNSQSQNGQYTLLVRKNISITTQFGDLDIDVSQGNLNITVHQNATINVSGNLNATVQGNASLDVNGNASSNIQGNLNVDVAGIVNVQSNSLVTIEGNGVNINSTGGADINYNTTGKVNLYGDSDISVMTSGNIFLGEGSTDSVVLKSEYDVHYHVDGPPGRTGPPGEPASVTQVRAQ